MLVYEKLGEIENYAIDVNETKKSHGVHDRRMRRTTRQWTQSYKVCGDKPNKIYIG